jgi:hypothetical protein
MRKQLSIFILLLCAAADKSVAALAPEDDFAETDITIDETLILVHEVGQRALDKKLWDVTTSPWVEEDKWNRLRTIDGLLEQGANPHAIINATTQATAIEYAFVHRNFDLLQLLLNHEYGDNINKSHHGRTLLQRASEDNDLEMINFLLHLGARWATTPTQPPTQTWFERIMERIFQTNVVCSCNNIQSPLITWMRTPYSD